MEDRSTKGYRKCMRLYAESVCVGGKCLPAEPEYHLSIGIGYDGVFVAVQSVFVVAQPTLSDNLQHAVNPLGEMIQIVVLSRALLELHILCDVRELKVASWFAQNDGFVGIIIARGLQLTTACIAHCVTAGEESCLVIGYFLKVPSTYSSFSSRVLTTCELFAVVRSCLLHNISTEQG